MEENTAKKSIFIWELIMKSESAGIYAAGDSTIEQKLGLPCRDLAEARPTYD